MKEEMLRDHLAQAERRVTQLAELIRKEMMLIAELEEVGSDTAVVRAFLKTCQGLYEMHVVDRDRLLHKLEDRRI